MSEMAISTGIILQLIDRHRLLHYWDNSLLLNYYTGEVNVYYKDQEKILVY